MFSTILLGLVVILIIFIFKLNKQYYTKEGIPIIGNFPWLGCGIAFNQRGGHFLKEIWKKHGDLFQIYVAGKTFTFVLNESFYPYFYKAPEKEISFFEGLMDKDSSFQLDLILDPIGETKEEQDEYLSVKPMRNYLLENNRSFTEKFIAPQFQFLFEYSLKEQNVDPTAQNFKVELFQMMVNFAGGFGANFVGGNHIATNEQFIKHITLFQNSGLKAITKPPLFNKGDIKATAESRVILRSIIRQSLIDHKTTEFGEEILTLVYQSTGRTYSLDAATHAIFGFIFATIANTNASATHALIEILANPTVRSKVEDEIRNVIALHPENANERDPSKYVINQSMIDKCEYLGYCLTETLRLYSPPVHVRKANVDIFSEDQRLIVPKNSIVCISPWIRHRDERIYENPNVFDPERFSRVNKTKFSFLTFGQGRHYCLGKPLAESIVKFTIAKLLLMYDIQLLEDKTSTNCKNPKIQWFSFGVVLPAGPVVASFSRRDHFPLNQ